MRLRPRILGAAKAFQAEPAQVTLGLGRPRMRIIDFRITPDDAGAEAAVEVLTRARSWIGRRGYWWARVPAFGPTGGSQYPAARTLRLRSVWVYELDGSAADWRFARFESPGSASYRYRRLLDTAAEDHEDIRDDLVLTEAAENGIGLKVPLEIAETLPRDADAALGELAGLDESFQTYVLEAAVREILDMWAEASESDRRLGAAASDAAAAQLLGPDGTVLRGPELLDGSGGGSLGRRRTGCRGGSWTRRSIPSGPRRPHACGRAPRARPARLTAGRRTATRARSNASSPWPGAGRGRRG